MSHYTFQGKYLMILLRHDLKLFQSSLQKPENILYYIINNIYYMKLFYKFPPKISWK